MSLAEFKSIYFWEYLHRLWGRLIGVAYALPLIYFVVRRRVPRRLVVPLAGIFLLGFAQGALGWYMVKSGLADRVIGQPVPSRRASRAGAAHLRATLWIALGILAAARMPRAPTRNPPPLAGEGAGARRQAPHPLSPMRGEGAWVAGGARPRW